MKKGIALLLVLLLCLLPAGCKKEVIIIDDNDTEYESSEEESIEDESEDVEEESTEVSEATEESAASSAKAASSTKAASSAAVSKTFKLTGWVDIYQSGTGWKEDIANYKPKGYNGTDEKVSNSWKLGDFSAEFQYKLTTVSGYKTVTEKNYTVSWTLPQTISGGTPLQIPINTSGKSIYTIYDYDGNLSSVNEKPYSARDNNYGTTYFSLYYGAKKALTGLDYIESNASDYNDYDGIVKMDTKDFHESVKVIAIWVTHSCGDMVLGRVYYYERA